MEIQPLDVSGRPMPGAKRVEWIQGKAKPVTKWGNGIVGIAEAMYPHPDRWRLADIDAPLDRVGVREMTRAFARREALAPNCKRKWDSLLGPTNWETVAKRYKQGFLTPKDYGSHYKCIAHRGLCTRKRKPNEAGLTSCRICGKTDETVEHLGECEGLKEVYTSLRKLDEKGEWRQPKLNLLGVSEKDGGLHEPLERGISAVHTIVWREMIGEITRVDTDGRRFSAQATLRRAKRRCVERMHAFEQQVANYTLRKEAKGEDPTDGYEGYQKQVQGILTVGEEGEIVIEPKMKEWLESIECTAEGDA